MKQEQGRQNYIPSENASGPSSEVYSVAQNQIPRPSISDNEVYQKSTEERLAEARARLQEQIDRGAMQDIGGVWTPSQPITNHFNR